MVEYQAARLSRRRWDESQRATVAARLANMRSIGPHAALCAPAQLFQAAAVTFHQRNSKAGGGLTTMFATIQHLIGQEAHLAIPAAQLTPGANLYQLGLTSYDAVRLLIAIEREFQVEFPEDALDRKALSSIEAIALAVLSLWQAELDASIYIPEAA
jgi:acyl carrier protein